MDSLITAAARALSAGDPLGALNAVALREDPPALALRGLAMAQLGDLERARALLRRAARAFGPREAVARARCIVAEAEIALVSRELGRPTRDLAAARATLTAHGDRINAAHAMTLEARRALLIGRLDEAERTLAAIDTAVLPPAARAACALATAAIAIRRVRTGAARAALDRADQAASMSGIPGLIAEVEALGDTLDGTAARLVAQGAERPLKLAEVETLFSSDRLVVDACRNVVRQAGSIVSLATRPVLFALARALAEAWPGDAARDVLVARGFGAKRADESHRARLRVEIGRLRTELHAVAEVTATDRGFALAPRDGAVAVLAPALEAEHPALLALLSDDEAWSSSALAIALGTSARTVQRALDDLARAGRAQSFGRGRACRWIAAPLPAFPTSLLLPGPLPGT